MFENPQMIWERVHKRMLEIDRITKESPKSELYRHISPTNATIDFDDPCQSRRGCGRNMEKNLASWLDNAKGWHRGSNIK